MVQVKSSASWTNEEFGKIYEPVSATELRRQHQVRHESFELHENGEIKEPSAGEGVEETASKFVS